MATSVRIRRWLKPRSAIRVGMLLVLGAAMNFGVMVFCVWVHEGTGTLAQRLREQTSSHSSQVELASVWPMRAKTGWPDAPRESRAFVFPWMTKVHAWQRKQRFRDEYAESWDMVIRQSGWPLQCWWDIEVARDCQTGSRCREIHGRLDVTGWLARRTGLQSLPVYPSPFRSMTNMVFWSLVAGAIGAMPGLVRAHYRRRRGLCPACAYPVGVSPVCTECGQVLRLRVAAGSRG